MPPPRVDADRITAEALRLLRQGGLEAVSLRRVAAGLGAGASTLYWHIRDKDALLAALSERIFRDCLDAVGERSSWRGWLRAFGLALWDAQVDIPDVHKLIVLARHDPTRRRNATAAISGTLERLGIKPEHAMPAQRSVQALVTGWTTLSGDKDARSEGERDRFARTLEVLIEGWAAAQQEITLREAR